MIPKARGMVCEHELRYRRRRPPASGALGKEATEHLQGTTEEGHECRVCGKNYVYALYLQLHMMGRDERRHVSSRCRQSNTRVISATQTISSYEQVNRTAKIMNTGNLIKLSLVEDNPAYQYNNFI